MHQDLLLTLAMGLCAGLICGFITQRIGVSPILGYLLAGVAIGPHTPGFVADAKIAGQLAEIGVILLMFGVGLHFHLKDLLLVRAIAVPGALGQSLVATALGTVIAVGFGWGMGAGVVLGLAVSVASTVVLMRVLIDHQALDTVEGHIAVGWLIVEDIFTVIVLVLLPASEALKGGAEGVAGFLGSLALALLKLAVFTVLILFVGAKAVPRFLTYVARSRSRELFTLSVLALALCIAIGSAAIFGASMALGAFLAGMVVGQSPVSHQAAADALPLRDAFAVLFFVSVGMLFDPSFLLAAPGLVASVLAVVLLAKPLAALLIVSFLGYSVRTALTVALGLAQIGEFSFILADAAGKLGRLPAEGYTVLVACALLSIGLNPLYFRLGTPLEKWLRGKPRLWSILSHRAEARGAAANLQAEERKAELGDKPRAVVVGYGPVGRTVSQILRDFEIEPIVVDLNVDTVSTLAAAGHIAIYGDARARQVLKTAQVPSSKYLLITLPDPATRTSVIAAARALDPDIKIFVRARYLAERPALEKLGASAVCYEEAEAAVGLAALLLREVGAREEQIRAEGEKIRASFAQGGAES
jgi:CPA2 family monovalent cation:H+ antiporter-2